jgi:hypothetical protein
LADEIANRNGLHINLLPETEEDLVRAKLVDYKGKSGREASLRRRELKAGSMVLGKRDRNEEPRMSELERVVKLSTRERSDPFLRGVGVKVPIPENGIKVVRKGVAENGASAGGALVHGYSSESD